MSIFLKNKGITLIALIITIVVLLILAGVTISQITGSENAMEKATEAREKNEQGAELDAIKLAVVNSIANGLNGLVDTNVLKNELKGLIDETSRNAITTEKNSWIVTTNSGLKYKIKQNGEVTSAEPVDSVEFTENTLTIYIGQSKTLPLSIKGKSGNETEANNIEYIFNPLNIAEVLDNGQVKILDNVSPNTKVTVTVIADEITSSNSCEITAKQVPVELGTLSSTIQGNYIDLGVDLDDDGNTGNDWKILYNDSENNTAYAITDKYLKISKVPKGIGLSTSGSYGVYFNHNTNTRTDLLNGLTDTDAWQGLVSENIRNNYINTESNETEIQVLGALPKVDSNGNATQKTMDYIKNKITNYYLPSNNTMSGYLLASIYTQRK